MGAVRTEPQQRPSTDHRHLRRDQVVARIVAEHDAAERGRSPIRDLEWVDTVRQTEAAVELEAVDNADGSIAVEHTRIESYPGQIKTTQLLQVLFPGGGPRLVGVDDASHHVILMRVDALKAIKSTDRQAAADELTAWARDAVPNAPWPIVAGTSAYVDGDLDYWGTVAATRWIPPSIGVIGSDHVARVLFWVPRDLEERRTRRVDDALEKKVPKLLASHTDRTILVLEDTDLSTSGPVAVQNAIRRHQLDRLPDAIYHWNSTTGTPLISALWRDHDWVDLGGEAKPLSPDDSGAFRSALR